MQRAAALPAAAVPFLIGIAVLRGLTVEIDTFHGSDARDLPAADDPPVPRRLDFSDYPSAQTPLFHLLMAGWGKLVGFELWRLRLLNVAISYGPRWPCSAAAPHDLARAAARRSISMETIPPLAARTMRRHSPRWRSGRIADTDILFSAPTLRSATITLTNPLPGDLLSVTGTLPAGITLSTIRAPA